MTAAPRTAQTLHVVAVSYALPPDAFASKLRMLALRSRMELRGVVVGNNPAHACPAASDGLHHVRGSNSLLDFSGYFEGLEYLSAHDPDAAPHNVLFVNDSLITKHASGSIGTRVMALHQLLQQIKVPTIAGKIDPYRAFCLKNPWSGHTRYVSSFCFLLNPAGLPLLRRLPAEAEAAGLSAEINPIDDAWARGMPLDLRELIRSHLVYRGSPQRWPQAGAADSALIRRKAYCAFFEHRLSGLFGQTGVVVPINAGPRSTAAITASERVAAAVRAARSVVGLHR